MRNPDLSLVGDLNDSAISSTSAQIMSISTSSINENLTNYELLPVIINKPPIITKSVYETSSPNIKTYRVVNLNDKSLYQNSDGIVQVHLGASFKLALKAEQPPILNVENGVLKILPPSTGLQYVWRKDGLIVTSTYDEANNTAITIKDNTITFQNIQTTDSGEYSCDVVNDIGVVTSEVISLEVINTFNNSNFFTNLVQNPAGDSETSNWSANNNDFITRQFGTISDEDLLKPNIVDSFSYSINSINPQPVQNLQKYFTTKRFKFDRKGGSFLVRAYQDIDLSEIKWLIEGGVYGIDGVRADFSCYIGNAINQFIPNSFNIQPSDRVNPNNYNMSEPRISFENYMKAGPAKYPSETIKVYLTEYEYGNKLLSQLVKADGSIQVVDNVFLQDPWSSRYNKYAGRKYNSRTNGDDVDVSLFVADELLPNKAKRYTYGQFIEYNNLTLSRLNSKTNKIRITIDFETNDARIFEQWQEAQNVSDEVFEFTSTQEPYYPNSVNQMSLGYSNFISTILKNTPGNENKDWSQIMSKAQDPRGLVTGLDLRLTPIYSKAVSNSNQISRYYLPKAYD